MFRDMYKKANDDIRGDRAILDRAFLQAAQPVKKKSPVIKYSFIGTAVAAVVVLGAVFANPSVFTNRSEDLGKYNAVTPTENVEIETNVTISDIPAVVSVDVPVENDVPVNTQVTDEKAVTPKVNTVAPKKETVPAVVENTVSDDVEAAANDGVVEGVAEDDEAIDDYGIAVMSLEGGEEGVYEQPSEEAAVGFTLRDSNVIKEDNSDEEDDEWIEEPETKAAGGSGGWVEEATETATEAETTEAVEMFSYMYDVSCYGEGAVTEGFVNTDVSSVATADEAIMRAENECKVNYNNIYVYCDSIEDMWKVVFSCDDLVASEQIVYMNFDGVTQMIVYCE